MLMVGVFIAIFIFAVFAFAVLDGLANRFFGSDDE
jgi:hypothetical protein